MVLVRHALKLNEQLLNEIADKAQSGILSPEEVQQQLVTERLVTNQREHLARLEAEAARAVNTEAIAQFMALWPDLVTQADEDMNAVCHFLAQAAQALATRKLTHAAQEALVARLPASLRQRLSFPSWDENLQRMKSRLPPDLFPMLSARGPSPAERAAMRDVDVGSQDLTRIVQRYLCEVTA
jgi:hypothetical protein